MLNYLKKIALICSVIISVTACSKEEQNNPATNGAASPSSNEASLKQTSWGVCCVWNGVDKCVDPKVNCFDIVDVQREAYEGLVDAANGGVDAIATYFNGEAWREVFPDLDADEGENINLPYLELLQSGNYDMIVYNNADENRAYFLAGLPEELSVESAEFTLSANIPE